jgi:hypothetical protein
VLVSLIQGSGYFNGSAQELFGGKRPLLQSLRQGLPFHLTHHQEVIFVFSPKVLQGGDVCWFKPAITRAPQSPSVRSPKKLVNLGLWAACWFPCFLADAPFY